MDANRSDQLESGCTQLLDQMTRMLESEKPTHRFWKLDKRLNRDVSLV